MIWSLVFFVLFILGWSVAFFGYIKPKFLEFRRAMGIQPLLDAGGIAPLTFWQRAELRLRGLKGTILAFLSGVVLAITQLLDVLDPTALAPIKDSTVWQGIGGQNFALRAVSFVTLLMAFLSIRGQVRAAKQMPNPPPPPPMAANG